MMTGDASGGTSSNSPDGVSQGRADHEVAESDGPTEPTEYPDHGLYTIPNLITLLRLCCLPIFLWMLFSNDDRLGAAVLLGALGATDWCDGYIARNFNQTSDFGKNFDPTADRILFFVAITAIIIDGSAPLWFSVIILAREVTVAAITVTLLGLGAKPVHVTWFGKAGTFCLMFACPLWLGGSSTSSFAPFFTALGWAFGLPGFAFSFYAAFRYLPLWREALREARS